MAGPFGNGHRNAHNTSKQLCRYWGTPKGCNKGKSCRFLHERPSHGNTKRFISNRENSIIDLVSDEEQSNGYNVRAGRNVVNQHETKRPSFGESFSEGNKGLYRMSQWNYHGGYESGSSNNRDVRTPKRTKYDYANSDREEREKINSAFSMDINEDRNWSKSFSSTKQEHKAELNRSTRESERSDTHFKTNSQIKIRKDHVDSIQENYMQEKTSTSNEHDSTRRVAGALDHSQKRERKPSDVSCGHSEATTVKVNNMEKPNQRSDSVCKHAENNSIPQETNIEDVDLHRLQREGVLNPDGMVVVKDLPFPKSGPNSYPVTWPCRILGPLEYEDLVASEKKMPKQPQNVFVCFYFRDADSKPLKKRYLSVSIRQLRQFSGFDKEKMENDIIDHPSNDLSGKEKNHMLGLFERNWMIQSGLKLWANSKNLSPSQKEKRAIYHFVIDYGAPLAINSKTWSRICTQCDEPKQVAYAIGKEVETYLRGIGLSNNSNETKSETTETNETSPIKRIEDINYPEEKERTGILNGYVPDLTTTTGAPGTEQKISQSPNSEIFSSDSSSNSEGEPPVFQIPFDGIVMIEGGENEKGIFNIRPWPARVACASEYKSWKDDQRKKGKRVPRGHICIIYYFIFCETGGEPALDNHWYCFSSVESSRIVAFKKDEGDLECLPAPIFDRFMRACAVAEGLKLWVAKSGLCLGKERLKGSKPSIIHNQIVDYGKVSDIKDTCWKTASARYNEEEVFEMIQKNVSCHEDKLKNCDPSTEKNSKLPPTQLDSEETDSIVCPEGKEKNNFMIESSADSQIVKNGKSSSNETVEPETSNRNSSSLSLSTSQSMLGILCQHFVNQSSEKETRDIFENLANRSKDGTDPSSWISNVVLELGNRILSLEETTKNNSSIKVERINE